MESYLRQFLAIEGRDPAARRPVDAAVLAEEVLALLRPSFNHAGVAVDFHRPAEPLVLQGDAETLRPLITNLVLNALEAAKAGAAQPPRVEVSLSGDGPHRGRLCVRDTGPGPPPAIHDRLFDSFVTTKPDGAGLGLFVARQIAERHGGSLRWHRETDATCFLFEFPLWPTY
jgi:signal transduction histidine kinase